VWSMRRRSRLSNFPNSSAVDQDIRRRSAPRRRGRDPVARRVDRRAFAREFPSGDPSATECAQNLILASSRLTDADTRALRRHGLSVAARIMLATIEDAGEPLPANVLAERLLVSGASITSLVDTPFALCSALRGRACGKEHPVTDLP
jgi:hypothetical protein